ncbi:MAG: NADH-quinone oxidoreductase subunit E [Candidatus Schekmanbacteria bacterium RIFCSPHIGHO2_02_FULL_38_11]|uniref:NADH-quinone oxidoreductase subunit E n=1 Tax=Candidatus Schekmanbacteria bacterium RIFCSPLOWO2_12_FULL_38_15 TaxID=1817883 RepID=A0A1F7SFH6_9BACT|nr:MAG: NADH-quinone oxidoreductase subunit E [Candidatus Schekmanbacteria bacterium GWA2_38_9]OGL48552.1 MAG: NADH-quinone oxidoreductase subunit E [Candidatus Schekmanbacteria bacterium RIFCSPLOWO2_02_FULL_38_14]OGL52532.1 MAG: NADH-quinone oxidoreductase subunit E [Candidatus Schekmanbacteria bacterium RIFCSPLOWO2_12_FULL_38_15]OGL54380.1 MAG: NADH-quinone oxidoreductase subunit E [Candidatus Schekmanbacteria bacterium RIFCSPHIGHO2_02_FULL_38_11]
MVMFSEKAKQEFEEILKKYPDKQAGLLPTLYLAQREFGYISREVMDYVASIMGLPQSEVYGVATFYTMYNKKPVGKYFIQVCNNISCSLLNAEKIVQHIEKKLGIQVGETTIDNRFTLVTVECLGSCGTAPMMQINEDYYEDLSIERVDEILEKLK